MHEMHGRLHPNPGLSTILLAHGPISKIYPSYDHLLPSRSWNFAFGC